jgi:hypothetical protein
MTMMVLAIRFYDVGMRDDATFWFYVAKARYITLEDVIDVRDRRLAQAGEAVKSFAILAGPVINGYAYCNPPAQHAKLIKAIDWVENNPYAVVHMTQLPARPGDRSANLARSIKVQREQAEAERVRFDDPKFAAEFSAARRRNDADEKFCWR